MRQSAEISNISRKKAPLAPTSAAKNKRPAFETHEEDEDTDMDGGVETGEGGDTRSDWDMEGDDGDEYSNGDNLLSQNDMLEKVMDYGRQMQEDFKAKPELQEEMDEVFSLFAYSDPTISPMAHLLSVDGRAPVAEALNSAILVSLGKSSKAPLERLVQQTTVLLRELGEEGGTAAFFNLHNWIHNSDYLPNS
ncbi:hypothetical protein ABW20_dc0110519 [Dactylellina cionopaga]|nr:hypothetical protein ABW20_dc0110519 [Dactylellina cionopaga]